MVQPSHHRPKIKPAIRRDSEYKVRLPHFVKTSCGTPSRELFRFGLPAHRHRREGWLGQLIPSAPLRLRGNRDDLTAQGLVKSTCFRTGNRWLHD